MMLGLIVPAIVLFAGRVWLLLKSWVTPLKNGPTYFLTQRVKPDFYADAGATLFRRFRMWLVVWLVADAPLVLWLAFTGRYSLLFSEQFLAWIATIIGYTIMAVHFSYRAAEIGGLDEDLPAAVQLSMTPRRLRDHLRPAIETVIVTATLLSLGILGRCYALSLAPGASHDAVDGFQSCVAITAWLLYWQIGLLVLKGAYIHWRMPLPANRTEDFRRWREAWLNHHLRVWDAVRLLIALGQLLVTIHLLGRMTSATFESVFPRPLRLGVVVAGEIVYAAYLLRESRRIAAAVREMKPVEMVKEFPRAPVAAGRYLAGGFIYFNPENPGVIVRGVRGVAINLAHPSTYACAAYLFGHAALMTWMVSVVFH
jgi:hypothetical protein